MARARVVITRGDVARAFEFLEDLKGKFRNRRILVKPNLCGCPPTARGAHTDVRIVRDLITYLLERVEPEEIVIGETDATMNNADPAFDSLGYRSLENLDPRVKVRNLSKEEPVRVSIEDGLVLDEIAIPRTALTHAIIDVPKLKTHVLTGVTIGVKNLFGLLIEKRKVYYHRFDMHKVLVDILSVLRPELTVVDALTAMEGLGPCSGRIVDTNLVIAGYDVVAVDAVSCKLIGVDPMDVDHLRLAHERGLGCADLSEIEIIGESIEELERKFRVPLLKARRILRDPVLSLLSVWELTRYQLVRAWRRTLLWFRESS